MIRTKNPYFILNREVPLFIVNLYIKTTQGTSKMWSLKSGSLYTKELHRSPLDSVENPIVVT